MLDCFKKEFGCGNNSSHSIVYLSYNECLIFTILSDYLLVFGFLGFIAQAYVVFCYGYRRNEEFIPIQVLILGTSVFDMLCCFGLVFNFSLIRYPTFYEIRTCSLYFAFTAFNETSVYFTVLLFAANRYYSICRPVLAYMQKFTNLRITFYFAIIFVLTAASAVINVLSNCVLTGGFLEQDALKRTLQSGLLIFNSLCLLPILIIIILMYLQIWRKLRNLIAEQKMINEMAAIVRMESFNDESYTPTGSSSFCERDLYPLEEELKIEKSYLHAIAVFSGITIPLLIGQFTIQIVLRVHRFLNLDVSSTGAWSTELTLNFVIFSVFTTLYVINPIVFYSTNEDFKIKLRRPLRPLLWKIFPNYDPRNEH